LRVSAVVEVERVPEPLLCGVECHCHGEHAKRSLTFM
jgi:hypothetical protein